MLVKSIKQISLSVTSGLTPLRSNKDYWSDGTVPWLKTEQLGTKYVLDTNEFISEKALAQTSLKINPVNTLSIAMYGEGKTRGSVSILKKPMATNQACCNIVLNPNEADVEYLYYYLVTQYENLRNQSSGVRKNLNSLDIKQFAVRLPSSVDRQRKIAFALTILDKKIELNSRINAELEAMAKMLYDYWFVQFDFPDANGQPYKTSGGKMVWNEHLKRDIPEGWESGIAKDLMVFNPSEKLRSGSAARCFDMAAIPTSGFSTDKPKEGVFSGGSRFRNGDVVMARITPCLENGKTAIISRLFKDEVGYGSTEFIVARGRADAMTAFIANLLRSQSFRKFSIRNMTGTSGRKRVEASAVETFALPLPPLSLILKFEKKLNAILNMLNANVVQNDELSELRNWLLPMLMNGQVTVGE